jgi:addiction module RelE/StbE family toxin
VKLVWTEQAIQDLAVARAYVAKDNPGAAATVARRTLQATEKLFKHPEIGRKARLAGTRELVIPGTPYLIPYRIHGDRIELLRILHGRQQYP